MSAAPAVLLALAAHAARFDPALEEHDAHAQYEQSRRPVGVLLAVFPAVVLARSLYNYGRLLNDPGLVLAVFGGTTLAFLWIAATSRPRSQWIAWSVVWGLHLVLWTTFFRALAQPAS